MDRQALREAVMGLNARGPDGLVDRAPPGRAPRLSQGGQAVLRALVLRGPDPERSGLPSWTLPGPCRQAQALRGKRFHPAGPSRILRRPGLSRQQARRSPREP